MGKTEVLRIRYKDTKGNFTTEKLGEKNDLTR